MGGGEGREVRGRSVQGLRASKRTWTFNLSHMGSRGWIVSWKKEHTQLNPHIKQELPRAEWGPLLDPQRHQDPHNRNGPHPLELECVTPQDLSLG